MNDFKKPKFVLIILAGLVGIWHLTTAMTSKISIAGPFMAKPVEGYTWIGADNAESRFFWQNTDVKWQAGTPHPEFKVETTEIVGIWDPMPGYEFIDKTRGLQTVWKSGLLHPDYMAWSDKTEGQWSPVTGYKFIYDGDTFTETVWNPNHRYQELKVISLADQDKYAPFPGYQFIKPNESLEVVWVPGTINYENPKQIAGQQEGSWVTNSRPLPPRYRSGGLTPGEAFVVGAFVGGAVGYGVGRRHYYRPYWY
ncbi:hypothetical protein P1X15_08645 [Runella sp. MFBS21]|uniref:hypothetical protein n=1 Tax=Runella sp. MFBS21 TaxID=3034018 RepID=UPI0023F90030|nr:hypothetical protein [Runella sp. MFBS21]MDF7817662.1 hypothetical protein [Runella sp. MFBS21]